MMRFPPSDSHLFVGFAAEAETATFTGCRRQAEAVGTFCSGIFFEKKTDPTSYKTYISINLRTWYVNIK